MDFQVYGYSLVPLIIVLVSAIRRAGLPPRYLPLLSIFLGVLAGIFYLNPEEPRKGVLEGIVLGLLGVGLRSSLRSTFRRKESE